ncbi:MAG TPA: serine/threonine-protein kinase [Polyangiaceae bacterium]|nr:serine/threonine-protein kinase [Polyangiaceae bacterium]
MNPADAQTGPDAGTSVARAPVSVRPGPAVRLGSLPGNSEQDLRLIQDRISLFAVSAFFITAMFLVAMTGLDLGLEDGQGFQSSEGRVFHVLATLAAFGAWRIAQRRRLISPAALGWLDAAGTIGVCISFAAMGHFSMQPFGFYTALLAILHVNVGRASLVPSVATRTLGICAASFAGVVLSRALLPLPPGLVQSGALRLRWVLEAALWSGAGSGVATLASQVIYGLHERALEARQLGQYQLEQKIGQGGMGEIYRARHAMLRRPTAVKLISGTGSEERLRRFEKEVQLTARLTHPNTISIFDYGRTPDGTFYYAMELLEGLTVEQLVERHGPQPPARVVHLLQQACGALSEAHGIGLIHRDIKPANLYLCRRGGVPDFVKVLDFGLVRELRNDGDSKGSNIKGSQVDTVVGTPLYLSPEAILSPDRVDARADLYGLGGVAYFLLTGSPPFNGRGLVEICSHHLHTQPEPPSRRRPVPPELDALVLRCLAKDPSERPQTAAELADALRACDATGTWSTNDAERWWRELGPMPAPELVSEPSGEQPRVTVCAVDLKRRLGERQRSA